MAVINTFLRWSYKFKNVFFKDVNTFVFSDIFVKFAPCNYSKRKKEVFKKIMTHIKRRNIFQVLLKYDLLDTGVILRYFGDRLFKIK